MAHVIIFDESTDIRMDMYVMVLNQNTRMVRKNLFWGPGWKRGGTTSFYFSSRGRTENF